MHSGGGVVAVPSQQRDMAWLASGSSNAELVRNLRSEQLIKSSSSFEAFSKVDRGEFVPGPAHRSAAYRDEPFHYEEFHLSAPHIYAWVMELLKLDGLRNEAEPSFLNLGSGTGYLSYLVAAVVGDAHLNVGVERVGSLVEFAATRPHVVPSLADLAFVRFVHGDLFQVELPRTAVGFSRIYVGGGAAEPAVARMRKLLKPGGIMVVPREDELVRIARDQTAPGVFHTDVITKVRFSALVQDPYRLSTWCPSQVPTGIDTVSDFTYQSQGGVSRSRVDW